MEFQPPPPPSVVPVHLPSPPPPPTASSLFAPQYTSLALRLRSYDSETYRFIQGLAAPPLVCGSIAYVDVGSILHGRILSREEALAELRAVLDSDCILVGANIAYDLAVAANESPDLLPFIFKAFGEGRVVDILILQALDAIAGGHLGLDPSTWSTLCNEEGKQTGYYNLWNVVKMVLGRDDAKESSDWKMSYAILSRFPIHRWPPSAKKYPVDDVKNPFEVVLRQFGLGYDIDHDFRVVGVAKDGFLDKQECVHCHAVVEDYVANPPSPCIPRLRNPHRNIDCLPGQVEAAFAFQLGAVRGIRTDRARVMALYETSQAKRTAMMVRYKALGFVRPDETENQAAVKRAVAKAYGASGTCSRCGGGMKCPRCTGTGVARRGGTCSDCEGQGFLIGRIAGKQLVECRGEKVKGRYRGCQGQACTSCKGTKQVEESKAPSTCWMSDGGCDGTGLDVRTAPTLHTITTPTGLISISRDTLSESGDDDLHDYGESEHDKILDTYLPFLIQGVDKPITLSANPVLETLRASYSGVIQLLPTKGGVRECFCARDDHYFCSVDYAALELVTVSQLCLWLLGYSRQAEVINATKDPGMLHTQFGARMIGITVEEMKALLKAKDVRAKNTRQAAKVGNFTFWGGGGVATTVITNRARSKGETTAPDGFKYAGVRFCILLDGAERCGERKVMEWGKGERKRDIPPTCLRCLQVVQNVLRPAWYKEWPESQPYFDKIQELTGTRDGKRGVLNCLGRKFWEFTRESGFQKLNPAPIAVVVTRGGVKFTDSANGGFQTLAALGAKHALCKVTREAYLDRDSPLFGTRPIIFAHDEIISEMHKLKASKAAPRKALVMREAMKEVVPDVHVGAEPALMKYLCKDADAVYDESGELICWEPKEKAA